MPGIGTTAYNEKRRKKSRTTVNVIFTPLWSYYIFSLLKGCLGALLRIAIWCVTSLCGAFNLLSLKYYNKFSIVRQSDSV